MVLLAPVSPQKKVKLILNLISFEADFKALKESLCGTINSYAKIYELNTKISKKPNIPRSNKDSR